MRQGLRRAILSAVLAASCAGAAVAQEGPGAAPEGAAPSISGPTIVSVTVQGAAVGDSTRALNALGIRRGAAFDAAQMREALRRVWALELYDDFWLESEPADSGIALTLHVTPRPRIARVEFTGNKKIKSDHLLEHSGLVVGARLSEAAIAAGVDSVQRMYREKGYVAVKVGVQEKDAGPDQKILTLAVTEGPSGRVAAFSFPGATHFTAGDLRKRLASRKKGFLRSGKVDPEKLAKDLDRLTEFYRSRGYRDVEVNRDSLQFSPDGRKITLSYRIQEGSLYHIRDVRWEGNKALADAQLKTLKQPAPGDVYDASAIKKTVEDTYAQYAELGYLYVNVDPSEQTADSNRVDLVFRLAEGAPSRLRRIYVTGNTRTKEKVVRRELTIHEGDLFRRSALVRSQQDVFRLGFFQDVQVDFKPADSTDVDLYFKVVEKETGTASAGAGYSSEGGLTGFIQLGHNNLFGAGQAVSIAVERGSRRNTFDISYTDPWFRDSRTTLGFGLFRRDQQTEVVGSGTSLEYRDRRVGGSVRLGRPLRFIDPYTRGYLTYRLERVDVLVDKTVLSAAESTLRALLNEGKRTTSAIELNLHRDKTINPFYPTGGSRLDWNTEVAGRALGGNVEYHKHEADARFYFPSLIHPITTMVRGRLGFIGNFGETVPTYERFRLGGTTFYGLRGYEDYEIVPVQNIQEVPTVTKDSLGVVIDTTGFTEIRYPGGRFLSIFTLEQQFPIVHPLHGVLFFDAGNTWNNPRDVQPFVLKKGVGAGLRIEVPLLGNMGLDFGYGFDRKKPGWRTHFLLGNMFF